MGGTPFALLYLGGGAADAGGGSKVEGWGAPRNHYSPGTKLYGAADAGGLMHAEGHIIPPTPQPLE